MRALRVIGRVLWGLMGALWLLVAVGVLLILMGWRGVSY